MRVCLPPSPQENSEDDKKRGRSTDSEISQVGPKGMTLLLFGSQGG